MLQDKLVEITLDFKTPKQAFRFCHVWHRADCCPGTLKYFYIALICQMYYSDSIMKCPIVSIILPNRNYEKFIPDAIASIKAQTMADWECIIIDDASTDNSVEVIKTLINDDPRFKLAVNSEPLGISATRNVGMDMATGEYIAFLDSDDCFAEYFLEMLVAAARKTNVDVIGALSKIVDVNFHFTPSNAKWNIDDYTLYDNPRDVLLAPPNNRKFVWIWRRIYKRSVLKDVRFHDEMKVNGDDIMFMADLMWRVSCFVELNIEGVYHRSHGASISSVHQMFNMDRVKIFPLIFKHIRDDLLDKYDRAFLSEFYSGLFMLMLSECFIKFGDRLTFQNKKDLRKILSQACKFIVKKYLPFKQRLLCRYLTWIK